MTGSAMLRECSRSETSQIRWNDASQFGKMEPGTALFESQV